MILKKAVFQVQFLVVIFFQNWHFWILDSIFEIKMIKKICLGVFRFEIGGLRRKLWRQTWSNQLLKILLIKMFSNHSDFCFHITIHKILDKKSLYGRKNFISEKKIITKNFEKKTFFKIITKGGRWRNFSLTFPESTKNLVVIIHRS